MKQTFFTPGRTELAGNHTDHQRGRVLAASVDAGITAEVEKNNEGIVRIVSDGGRPFEVDIFDLEPRARERGTSAALCRGVLCALDEQGAELGGFTAQLRSDLRPGGGLSSSAAFSVLMGRIVNGLFNGGVFTPVELAKAAQEAENCHFGKPSGLMDQLACSVGGAVYIDFLTGEISAVECGFASMGLTLCLVDTGGSHSGLTADYALIPEDMAYIAAKLGAELLGEADPAAFFAMARTAEHGREYDRAAHFFTENARVPLMRDALLARDGKTYIELMNESGRSSERLLKNTRSERGDDSLERGLAISKEVLEGVGAWRVHGGGFAGCVQALMPKAAYGDYKARLEDEFGAGACMEIKA